MTRALPLGFSPASGRDAVADCLAVKAALRHKLGREPDGAWLQHVEQDGRRGLTVQYDATIPGAEQWASRAMQAAPEAWESVRGRKREVVCR